jgi:hypothetical protein
MNIMVTTTHHRVGYGVEVKKGIVHICIRNLNSDFITSVAGGSR